ncbi:MAG: peroxiredoxin-like family protein [Chloroflexota bacterium]
MTLHAPNSLNTEAARAEWFEHWQRGPTRLRWNALPVQVGDPAPDVDLTDARSGSPIRLASAWSDRPALLLFWRHFGCSCGRDRCARLIGELEAYRGAGADVVLIGQGEPERATVYAAANDLPPDLTILCDPDERAYRAFGILEGGPAQMLFDAPDEFLRCEQSAGQSLAADRLAQGRPMVDNPWLLPAEFVVASNGDVVQAHRYQWCEDYPDPRVNIASIRHATGELVPAYARA